MNRWYKFSVILVATLCREAFCGWTFFIKFVPALYRGICAGMNIG